MFRSGYLDIIQVFIQDSKVSWEVSYMSKTQGRKSFPDIVEKLPRGGIEPTLDQQKLSPGIS